MLAIIVSGDVNMYHGNIEKETLENSNFRKVLFTGQYMQLVVMTLKEGEEIGTEVHSDVDQFFRVEAGEAKFVIDEQEYLAGDGDAIIVPAGFNHNVINNSAGDLKLYTIYTPPEHPHGTIHKTKKETENYMH
ncbi:MAG: cupin domain-containing protein [Candidatus Woesearchaeota archaeon]